jgi:hypothetical protein
MAGEPDDVDAMVEPAVPSRHHWLAGLSKAYSSLLAFVACPPELKRLLKVTAPPYLYSGPSRSPPWPACSSGSRSTRPGATSCGP